MRVPATTGLPIITVGSETIIGSLIVDLLPVTLAASPHASEKRADRANAGAQQPGLALLAPAAEAACWTDGHGGAAFA
jgi:hypothetical protein